MSVTSFDSVTSFGLTNIAIGIGATVAQWMTPVPGQLGWILAPAAMGGTFEIYPPAIGSSAIAGIGLGFGTTQTQAALAGFSGQGFYVGLTAAIPAFQINGPAQFYIGNSSGATVLVKVLSLKGQGF